MSVEAEPHTRARPRRPLAQRYRDVLRGCVMGRYLVRRNLGWWYQPDADGDIRLAPNEIIVTLSELGLIKYTTPYTVEITPEGLRRL